MGSATVCFLCYAVLSFTQNTQHMPVKNQ